MSDEFEPNADEIAAIAGQLQQAGAQLRAGKSGRWRAATLPAGSSLSDEQWESLAKLQFLVRLEADGADVRDPHVKAIARLPRLTQLDLCNTAVTDACVDDLMSMAKLQLLRITGTNISKEALAQMRKAMLATRIVKL